MLEWVEIIIGFITMGVLLWVAFQFRKMSKEVRGMRKRALKVSEETTRRLQKEFQAVVDDDRYLQDVSKGGRSIPTPPKVDPEDKLRIAKGDDWGG
jgi:hypothetical protein